MSLKITRVNGVEEITEVAKQAAEIWREYYISIITIEQINYMIDKFQSVVAITEQIHHQNYEYFLIQQSDSSTVGYLSVKQAGEKLFLSKFYIAKKHRGQGYASQAMAFLEGLCQDRNISYIWLTVNRNNASSIAVYLKKGFRTIREEASDIGNGFIMDDYIMGKEIFSH